MRAGASGGLFCSGSGTLGVLVKFPDLDHDVYLLSCSHVIAKCGQFSVPFADVQDFIKVVQQPVATPCDASVNRIGLLQDGFSKIVPASEGNTEADLALAKLDPEVAAETNNLQAATGNSISDIATEDPATWEYGMQTWLLGVANRNASGSVIKFNGDTAEMIDFPTVGTVSFTGLVRYSTSCAEGDSGGAVVDSRNRLLGIHIAGDRSGSLGLFLPVGAFLAQKGMVLF
ncbi:MAG TPA: trypsin-like peptidase domain-containing protein [Bryobacteraceae bacterium]|nr:trypsin-like peptidase domain-containing protein [Bryobacteraceae bacterium]